MGRRACLVLIGVRAMGEMVPGRAPAQRFAESSNVTWRDRLEFAPLSGQ